MPSFTRLSARSTVTVRRGSVRAIAPTAVASVGATAAPSTHAGPHGTPSACATAATAHAVSTTSSVEDSTMPRRLARISRTDTVSDSQYRSAGRNTSSISCGGRCTARSAGTDPRATPISSSTMGGAMRVRRPTAVPITMTAPSTTSSSRAIMRGLPGVDDGGTTNDERRAAAGPTRRRAHILPGDRGIRTAIHRSTRKHRRLGGRVAAPSGLSVSRVSWPRGGGFRRGGAPRRPSSRPGGRRPSPSA